MVTMQRIKTIEGGLEEGTKNGNDRMKCPIQSSPYHSKKKKDYASVPMILIFREPSSVLISHPPPSRTVLKVFPPRATCLSYSLVGG